MKIVQSRRRFLTTVSLAGAASFAPHAASLGLRMDPSKRPPSGL